MAPVTISGHLWYLGSQLGSNGEPGHGLGSLVEGQWRAPRLGPGSCCTREVGSGVQRLVLGSVPHCAADGPGTQASAVALHGLSCSAACGIFPDQGLNLCPLYWQVER